MLARSLTKEEIAAILAGLSALYHLKKGEPVPSEVLQLACDFGEITNPLDQEGIDNLAESLNCSERVTLEFLPSNRGGG